MTTSQYNLKVQKRVAVVSFILFAVKMFAWYVTGSVAILTDALESIVNVLAAFIGVFSLFVSAKPKDADHPYGHGKVEFITAAIEGTLILVAGFFIIYEAVDSILKPTAIIKLDWGIVLVAATALVNYVLGSICLRTGKKNNSLALISSGKHLHSDTYTTIGIVLGLVVLYFTKIWWIDCAIAILFSFILIYTGYKIIRSSVAGIMDEADEDLLNNLVLSLNENRTENWIDLHNLRIIKYGPTLHLDCHLTVPWYFNVIEAHQEVDNLAALVKNKYGESVELFVHSDACMENSCKICYKQNCAVRQFAFSEKIEWNIHNISKNKRHSTKS
ncbi:MAG TPA: cation diffusion facilitator family transporter [Ferruginibacter sp.]|nr:cation diffusion facilitator family transporter [Ferruginibacter sp.]HRE64065.1 cation diffusion facilitator family transporter [Ferruginibacter sp.]